MFYIVDNTERRVYARRKDPGAARECALVGNLFDGVRRYRVMSVVQYRKWRAAEKRSGRLQS